MPSSRHSWNECHDDQQVDTATRGNGPSNIGERMMLASKRCASMRELLVHTEAHPVLEIALVGCRMRMTIN